MSFKEWLYTELVNDGTIGEEDYLPEDIDRDTLLYETDIEEADIDNYMDEFKQYCNSHGITPIWDLDD